MSYHGMIVKHPLTPEDPDAERYIVCLRELQTRSGNGDENMKAKTVTAQQYLDAEKPAIVQAHRDRLISAIRTMGAPRDVIAEVVDRIEQSSDTEIEALVMRAADRLPRDEHDEIARTALANVVFAIYRGDCETAVWLLQFAAANGEASVRDMLADFDAAAVLAQARDVVSERQN